MIVAMEASQPPPPEQSTLMPPPAPKTPAKRKIQTTLLEEPAKKSRLSDATTTLNATIEDTTIVATATTPGHSTAQQIPQSTFTIAVDQRRVPANSESIASVRVQNFVSNSGQRSSKFRAQTKQAQLVWHNALGSHISVGVANKDWLVLSTAQNEIYVYATQSGNFYMSILFEYPLVKPLLNGCICGALSKNHIISTWDLMTKQFVGRFEFPPQLKKNCSNIAVASVSITGLPMIYMKNAELWYYSTRLRVWQQIEIGLNTMTSLNSYLELIQKTIPNGLISKITLNKKQLKPSTVPNALVADGVEEDHLEKLLCAMEELRSSEEYALLASIYVNRLVSRGRIRRLRSYIHSLNNMTPDSQIDVDAINEQIQSALDGHPCVKQEFLRLTDAQAADGDIMGDMEDLGFLNTL